MIPYLGDFDEDATVYIAFNTFDSNDPSASVTITNLADGDLNVHKDGSATQIVTDGATIAIDFDSITGNHLATIDTSVDAAYATGSDYHVRMEGTTVDGATINAWIGHFSIENRFKEVDVTAISGDATAADNLELACDNYSATRGLTGTAVPAVAADGVGGIPISDAGGLDMDAILADTNELQVDWVNGGRLDLILDARMAEASISTTGGAVDTVTTVTNEVTADVTKISGDGTAADNLESACDNYSATRGLTGTAVPAVAADGAGGLPISDAGGLDMDNIVEDALNTAIAELGVAAPTATPTLRTGLMLLYMALRNKTVTQTSGTDALEIYNNAGTLIAQKLLTDDGSDYTEDEMTSG